MSVSGSESESEVSTVESEHEEKNLRFDPPVYQQRYDATIDILDGTQVRKVVDFGCNNMAFIKYLKKIDELTSILAVDFDKEVLENFHHRAEPIIYNTVCPRKYPLNISVFHGSVCDPDYRLIGCDAVVAIELIEHLDSGALDRLPQNIFGYIQPLMAIITTPNADFNVLFGEMKYNGFRHPDHRFEWTRKQFQDWSYNIVLRYPDYDVTFQDIGDGPKGTEHLGSCSQLALFTKKNYEKKAEINESEISQDVKQCVLTSDCEDQTCNKSNLWDCINWPENIKPCQYYEKIASYDYSFYVDTRTKVQKILDHVTYKIHQFVTHNDSVYYDMESETWKIPIEYLLPCDNDLDIDIDTLRNTLKTNGYEVERENIIYKEEIVNDTESEISNNSLDNETNDLNNEIDVNDYEDWTSNENSAPWGD